MVLNCSKTGMKSCLSNCVGVVVCNVFLLVYLVMRGDEWKQNF